MKAAEEYLIRGRLWARPRTTTKKAAIRQERKTCEVQIAEMQSRGKVRFKRENSHPVKLIERNINFSRQDGGQEKEE